MAHIRKETIENFDVSELLQMVKESLDELGITYEEKPGGFSESLILEQGDFETLDCERSFVLKESASHRRYTPLDTADLYLNLCEEIAWHGDDTLASAA